MSVAGKAFGEWIAVNYKTPTMKPEEVQDRIAKGQKIRPR